MAKTDTFSLSVVTPERAVLECDATFVALPAHDGEVGVLHDRAPFVFKLDAGRLRYETAAGKKALYVDGGFAEMVDNRLTVLTADARRPDELDRQSAERHLAEARAMLVRDDASYAARQKALRRARAQLALLR